MAEYGSRSQGRSQGGSSQGYGGGNSSAGGSFGQKKVFFRRAKSCPLSEKGAPEVDYKNLKLLSRFISERGKIMPRRITSVSAKKQRELAEAIKRARVLALLPYVNQ